MLTRFNARIAASITAIALGSFALAAPALEYVDAYGKLTTDMPCATFQASDRISTSGTTDVYVVGYVPQWSLGTIGSDLNGGNLKIASVEGAPAGIHVSLYEAANGGGADMLKFKITADPGVALGEYSFKVTLQNAQFGNEGTITLMAEVL